MKFINYLLCIVLALILACGFVTLGDMGKDVYVLDKIDIAIIEELESTPYTTYYSQLNDNQKRMYIKDLYRIIFSSFRCVWLCKMWFRDRKIEVFAPQIVQIKQLSQ